MHVLQPWASDTEADSAAVARSRWCQCCSLRDATWPMYLDFSKGSAHGLALVHAFAAKISIFTRGIDGEQQCCYGISVRPMRSVS